MTTAENLNRIIKAKSDIKQAIENKGVEVGDITIDKYADKINEITQSSKWVIPDGLSFGYSDCEKIDTENMDISNVTTMSCMFLHCDNITSLDLSSWDTSNVRDMEHMFDGCRKLTELRMGGDISKLDGWVGMFEGINTTGTFYYNSQYDYSKIISELPSTWTAVPY